MRNPERDPFLEGIKADIKEGLDHIERGEVIAADEVWAHFEGRIERLPPQDKSE